MDENFNNVSDQPRSVDGAFAQQFGTIGGLLPGAVIETAIPGGGLTQLDFYRTATAVSGGAWQNIGFFSFDPSTGVTQFHTPVASVPEPASLLLLGSGVLSFFASKRKVRK